MTSSNSPEFRGRSFSAVLASKPLPPREELDSSHPSAGPDWLTPSDSSPEGVCRSRSRSIILRKSKRRPAPPQRSISLRRDGTSSETRESRTQSLYLPNDPLCFLPDLILISKPRAGEEPSPVNPAKGKLSVNSGNLEQPEVMDPYCTMLPGVGRGWGRNKPPLPPLPPRGTLNPPLPSQTHVQPPTLSPPVTPTSTITGPSPLGCRMRPRASPPSQGSRVRLSLELPAPTSPSPGPAPGPDPSLRPRATRRHSDSSAFCRLRGLSASVAVMPVVTQEDLSTIRLRPLGAHNADHTPEPHDDVTTGEASCPPLTQGPKGRPPPVAAKPPVPRWLPGHTAETETPPAPQGQPVPLHPPQGQGQERGQGQSQDQGEGQDQREVLYMKVRRPKPKRSHQPQIVSISDDITQQQPHWPPGHVTDSSLARTVSQPETRSGEGSAPNRIPECSLQRNKKLTPPPVPRKPDVILRPSSFYLNCTDTAGVCLEEMGGERSSVPQIRMLCQGDKDDLHHPHAEDLFTIIHRSKKKLLSSKESVEVSGGRQAVGSPSRGSCDPRSQDQSQRSTSKTDSFMAFLQRRRSQKPTARERVSAAELLKTSKPLPNHNAELAEP
ncbi:NHS-like protein 2 [Osmerus mordax]|uniref:NHS-like protein 2 n=1 Tax=Osmerus mordax TaxID=8014 RepID=UPI00350F98A8